VLAAWRDRGWWPKAVRYTGGSVVATGCSELTFVLLYGPLHVTPAWSSVLAWLAGAVPNYWLNRTWAWRRQGRPSVRRELLPYALIVAFTLLLATIATRAADRALTGADISAGARVTLVAATFFGVYVVMFVLRFFLFDRLFGRLARQEAAADPLTRGPR
jgi:putative flippase GtrA